MSVRFKVTVVTPLAGAFPLGGRCISESGIEMTVVARPILYVVARAAVDEAELFEGELERARTAFAAAIGVQPTPAVPKIAVVEAGSGRAHLRFRTRREASGHEGTRGAWHTGAARSALMAIALSTLHGDSITAELCGDTSELLVFESPISLHPLRVRRVRESAEVSVLAGPVRKLREVPLPW